MTQETEHSDGRPIAFFDFDGTLTTADTLMPFLKFVVGAPKYYVKLVLVSPVLILYFVKLLRNNIAKQIVLKQYLAGYHIDELRQLGKRFGEEVIPAMLRSEGMERLRWHQMQGHDCVLVSASLDVYLKAWSRDQGFSSLMCTSLCVNERSLVSGKINGENCYGHEKVVRIKNFLVGSTYRVTYGYGDTSGDLPMLNFTDNGFLLQKNKKRRFRIY